METNRIGIINIDLVQNEPYEEIWDFTDDVTELSYPVNTASFIVMEVKQYPDTHSIIRLELGAGFTILGPNSVRILIPAALTRKLSGSIYQYDVLFGLAAGTDPVYLVRGQINVTNTISRAT